MIDTKRLQLKRFDLFSHYSSALFFLAIPVIDIYLIIKNKVNNNLEGYQRMIDGQNLAWFSLGIFFLLFFYKKNNLRFKELRGSFSIKAFNRAFRKTAQDLKWNIIEENEKYVIAKSNRSLGSWGEHITIIKTKNSIFINSICDPYSAKPAISSWGDNNQNMNDFLKNIKTNIEH